MPLYYTVRARVRETAVTSSPFARCLLEIKGDSPFARAQRTVPCLGAEFEPQDPLSAARLAVCWKSKVTAHLHERRALFLAARKSEFKNEASRGKFREVFALVFKKACLQPHDTPAHTRKFRQFHSMLLQCLQFRSNCRLETWSWDAVLETKVTGISKRAAAVIQSSRHLSPVLVRRAKFILKQRGKAGWKVAHWLPRTTDHVPRRSRSRPNNLNGRTPTL